MDSDETPTITDPTEAAWAATQRSRVIAYLASENCDHASVSLEPRWFLSPYLAIWAVRSKANPERIGWWAISGDVPTNYLTCTAERDASDILLSFAKVWKEAASYMLQGIQRPHYKIGPPGREKELAPLLLKRAETLIYFAQEIKTNNTSNDE